VSKINIFTPWGHKTHQKMHFLKTTEILSASVRAYYLNKIGGKIEHFVD
jgi:hypothetical protein